MFGWKEQPHFGLKAHNGAETLSKFSPTSYRNLISLQWVLDRFTPVCVAHMQRKAIMNIDSVKQLGLVPKLLKICEVELQKKVMLFEGSMVQNYSFQNIRHLFKPPWHSSMRILLLFRVHSYLRKEDKREVRGHFLLSYHEESEIQRKISVAAVLQIAQSHNPHICWGMVSFAVAQTQSIVFFCYCKPTVDTKDTDFQQFAVPNQENF